MVIAIGLAMVLACVVLARVARGSRLYAVFTALGVWLAVLLILYVLGVAL
jgi:cytochrome bd-type quinol oxidase subunit 1